MACPLAASSPNILLIPVGSRAHQRHLRDVVGMLCVTEHWQRAGAWDGDGVAAGASLFPCLVFFRLVAVVDGIF